MTDNTTTSQPPPDYREIQQQPPAYNPDFNPASTENQSDINQLTSIYEEDDNGLFGGISLFYFLLHSAFASLLPFLSIIFYHHGFSFSQIGTVYTASFLVSCLSSIVWSYMTKTSTNKHSIMLLSIAAWIIGFTPILWIKHTDPIKQCVMTLHNNTSSISTIHVITESAQPRFDNLSNGLEVWKIVDYEFIMLIGVVCLARIMQSGTDYFYFDHGRLLFPEVSNKLTITSYHISTKVSAAVITVFVGYVLDSVLFCNPSLGQFRIAFYLFLVFACFSLFVLYFLDVEYFQKQTVGADFNPPAKIVACPFIFKSILVAGIIIMGASRGVHYTFLQIRLASLDALYTQIGVVFAIHKITETCMRLMRRKICSYFGLFETFVIVLCLDGIRFSYFGFMHNQLMVWLLLPLELLSGFPAILFMNHSTKINNNRLVSDTVFFASYWCIGFSFGPIIFGFGYDVWSADYMFKGLGVVNLVLAVLLMFSYFTSSSREMKQWQQTNDRSSLIAKYNKNDDSDGSEENVEFLLDDEG